jgi:hypothetical protein
VRNEGAHHVPGVYQALRAEAIRRANQLDPRIMFMPPGPTRAEHEARNRTAAARRAKTALDLDAFEANRPARVPCWYFGGNTWPEHGADWPEWGQIAAYLVAPEDSVTPIWDSGPPQSPAGF